MSFDWELGLGIASDIFLNEMLEEPLAVLLARIIVHRPF